MDAPPVGERLRRLALKVIPALPFIVLALAVMAAIYHVRAYW